MYDDQQLSMPSSPVEARSNEKWFTEDVDFWSGRSVIVYHRSIGSDPKLIEEIQWAWNASDRECFECETDEETIARYMSLSPDEKAKVVEDTDASWACRSGDYCDLKCNRARIYKRHLSVAVSKVLSLPAFSHVSLDYIGNANKHRAYIMTDDLWDELKELSGPDEGWGGFNRWSRTPRRTLLSLAHVAETIAEHLGLWCRACKHVVLPGDELCMSDSYRCDSKHLFAFKSVGWNHALCERCWSNKREARAPLASIDLDRTKAVEISIESYVAYRERTAHQPPSEQPLIIRRPTIIRPSEAPPVMPHVVTGRALADFKQSYRSQHVTPLDIEMWKAAYDALQELGIDFSSLRRNRHDDIGANW